MTYVYADSTAVLGPLSLDVEPGAYDLCSRHAERTSTPKGWDIIRLPLDGAAPPPPAPSDDLMALADAVRAIGLREDDPALRPRGHTRSMRSRPPRAAATCGWCRSPTDQPVGLACA
ncbi:DUF3499 family protein [Tessaracoccus coleopterorum]|uniref:DUF3499 family protein n=1 Tax=Tessaracoccus coleopterorum TaxID=2714950 RepID=UPI001E4B9E4E